MNTTTATATATWDQTFETDLGLVRRILTTRGARFERLSGDRWVRMDTMKAAMAVADWAAREAGK
jgi:hypothetical protein